MTPRLPRTIDEMKTCLGQLITQDSVDQAKTFQARADDVFVVTYPKSGTTWMQQIVHGLRSGGSMDFGEITEVVPWLEACGCLGQDMEQTPLAPPRAYKSHFSQDQIPQGARYIYVVRDPKDVLLSFYHFFEGFMFEPGCISLQQFSDNFYTTGSKSGRYWEHLASWWPRRNNDNTLFFTFENLKDDLPGTVKKVADFLGIKPEPALLEKVLLQSSFAFMSSHNSHFDDHFLLNNRRSFCNLPDDVTTSKVRTGQSGGSKTLPSAISEQLDQLWASEIEQKLGFSDYASLRREVDALT